MTLTDPGTDDDPAWLARATAARATASGVTLRAIGYVLFFLAGAALFGVGPAAQLTGHGPDRRHVAWC